MQKLRHAKNMQTGSAKKCESGGTHDIRNSRKNAKLRHANAKHVEEMQQ